MATDKLFSVAGTSILNGVMKMRFANDFAGRIKILTRNGHEEVELFELGGEFSKGDCVRQLLATELLKTEEQRACATAFLAKLDGAPVVKSVPVVAEEPEAAEPAAESTNTVTQDQIEELLMDRVNNEEPDRPYTDEDLSVFLQSVYGVTVGRKTVGKMRKELGIPSSVERAKQ